MFSRKRRFWIWKLKLKALTWLRFCSRECVAHLKMQFLSFLTLQNLSRLLVYICFKSGHISPTKFCVPPSSHPCPCAGRILFSPILNCPPPSYVFVAVMFCLGLCILSSMRHQKVCEQPLNWSEQSACAALGLQAKNLGSHYKWHFFSLSLSPAHY